MRSHRRPAAENASRVSRRSPSTASSRARRFGSSLRTELQLTHPDLRRLMGLRVWPERDPMRIGVRLHLSEVGVEAIEVDHRHRGLDLVQSATDLVAEQLERPIRPGTYRSGTHARTPCHSQELPAPRAANLVAPT